MVLQREGCVQGSPVDDQSLSAPRMHAREIEVHVTNIHGGTEK